MTSNARMWEKRVKAWRASGLSSTKFSQGQEFTAERLRIWAYRLRKMKETPRTVPMARVVVAAPATSGDSPAEAPARKKRSLDEATLVLEAQGVKIALHPGFDRGMLASVLEVLDQRAAVARRTP